MRLNRVLNRPVQRRLDDYLVRRLDGHPARRPDYLARVCTLIEVYLRRRRRLARSEPHVFGRHAAAYYRDTVREEQYQREVEAALNKVYGPSPAGELPPRSVWSERYAIPPAQARFHRRWFRQKYGPE
jgi:hypothetical protein